MDQLCNLFLVFLMLLRLFIAALWSPAWKRADLLALVGDVYCIIVTLQCYNVSLSSVVLDCIVS